MGKDQIDTNLVEGPFEVGEMAPRQAGGEIPLKETTSRQIRKVKMTVEDLERAKKLMAGDGGLSYEEAIAKIAGISTDNLDNTSFIVERIK